MVWMDNRQEHIKEDITSYPNGANVTANFFDVMGVQPILGRLFTEAQETPGDDAVVVLSYGLWQRKFGGASSVLGQTITLNGRPHEIIGVMPGNGHTRSASAWRSAHAGPTCSD